MQPGAGRKTEWIIEMMRLYSALWLILSPLLLIWLAYRIYKDKEDWRRIGERFGFPGGGHQPKENIIWIHAASVGESMIALNLAGKLTDLFPNHNILITTGTVTSAKLVEARKPERAIHQFIPLDEYFSIKRFFKFWKPQLGITIESEVWPNLLDIGASYCPIVLVNAIMSDRSYNRWMGHRNMARYCFGKFTTILCQSERDTIKYSMLISETDYNESVLNIGNLKFAAPKPVVDITKLEALRVSCGSRPIVLAASTHSGDEDLICQMHVGLKKQYPDLLTIIAPRHVKRAQSIEQIINSYKMSWAVRSRSEELKEKTDIYLADTMGELGLFFSLANVTLIGGSFRNGGHNPIEPAFFDTQIIFGPDMSNFKDIAKEFLENKAAKQIVDLNELIKVAGKLLQEDSPSNAQKMLTNHDKIMDNYIRLLSELIYGRGFGGESEHRIRGVLKCT